MLLFVFGQLRFRPSVNSSEAGPANGVVKAFIRAMNEPTVIDHGVPPGLSLQRGEEISKYVKRTALSISF